MYEDFVRDKNSVDPAWWEFFEDYRPGERTGDGPPPTAPNQTSNTKTTPESATTESDAPDSDAQGTSAAQSTQTSAALSGSESAAAGKTADAQVTPSQPATGASGGTPNNNAAATLSEPAPEATAQPTRVPYAAQAKRMAAKAEDPAPADEKAKPERLRGAASRVVKNMETSLEVPTATSVRAIPAKLLVDNRIVINNHLARGRGGKVSFTHLIGFALVEAANEQRAMNVAYAEVDGKPGILHPNHVNLGLAIDLPKPDGTRQLLVPNVKAAETMDFAQFWASYEDMVRRARNNKLTVDDFAETTMTLTNPGTIGTVHSVPRLMQGQGSIFGVGSMDYPDEFKIALSQSLAEMGISVIL